MYMYKYIFIFESVTEVLTCNGSWKCVFSRTLKCMNNYCRFKEKIKYSLKYIIMIICVLNFQVISQCEYNYYVWIIWLIFFTGIYTYLLYFMNLYFWIKYIEMTIDGFCNNVDIHEQVRFRNECEWGRPKAAYSKLFLY